MRAHFDHDVILVQRRVHGRNLALAEGIVQRVVDRLGVTPESRRGRAIDRPGGLQPVICWSLFTSSSPGRVLSFCSMRGAQSSRS